MSLSQTVQFSSMSCNRVYRLSNSSRDHISIWHTSSTIFTRPLRDGTARNISTSLEPIHIPDDTRNNTSPYSASPASSVFPQNQRPIPSPSPISAQGPWIHQPQTVFPLPLRLPQYPTLGQQSSSSIVADINRLWLEVMNPSSLPSIGKY